MKPANEITQGDFDFFLFILENYNGYPKIRDLQELVVPRLNQIKINTILRYLEKSKSLEIDIDGNIIWFRRENTSLNLSLMEAAKLSPDFVEYISTKNLDHAEAKDSS